MKEITIGHSRIFDIERLYCLEWQSILIVSGSDVDDHGQGFWPPRGSFDSQTWKYQD